ncbi:MAG TPA: GNAT family N-acetyltransferase, partial [bacterium]|nr:GNAT family N-acetyltransferase [bacterium]
MIPQVQLRPWQWKDIPRLVQICNNVHIWNNLRDVMPRPYTKKDAEEWVQYTRGQQPQRNFCIEGDGEAAGGIGMVLQQDIYKRNIEIGYYIAQECWGRGYATEAVRLMVDYIFKTTDCVRIFAEVFAHNAASMSVLRKNGFRLE